MLKIISFKWDSNFTGIFCRVLGCVAQKHVLHCGISRSSSKVTGFTICGTRAANAQRNFGAHQRLASHPFVNLVGHRGALGLKA
ncbi:hypothetical protein ACCT09_55620, partial [Rhizobium ruizarguesonis]